MDRSARAILLALLGAAPACSRGRVIDVGPRRVSNQTAYPVMIYGEKLARGSSIRLGPPASLTLPTAWIDERHLGAVIPGGLAADQPKSERAVQLEVLAPDGKPLAGHAELTIVDDLGFPTPCALAVSGDGARVFVASRSTDEVWVYPRRDGVASARVHVGDGPRALAIVPAAAAPGGEELLAVADELAPELHLLKTGDPSARQTIIPVRVGAQDVIADPAGRRLYVSNHVSDTVQVVDLARGAVVGELPAGINPRSLALAGDQLAAAEIGADSLALIDSSTRALRRIAPRPLTPMLGSRGANGAPFVIGGTAIRALAWSPSQKLLFAASLGPNVGPNPLDMEAPSDGGIDVIDVAGGRFLRHVSLRGGPAQAIALDDARGWIYAADIGQGVIVALRRRRRRAPASRSRCRPGST
jgi:YVTN family beta-propeller protein